MQQNAVVNGCKVIISKHIVLDDQCLYGQIGTVVNIDPASRWPVSIDLESNAWFHDAGSLINITYKQIEAIGTPLS